MSRTFATTRGSTGTSINFANNETPSGLINSSNVTFTLSNSPSPAASLQLYMNGQLQVAGGIDYSLSGNTITFIYAPLTGSILRAFYRF